FCQVRYPPSCSPVGDRGVRFQVTGAGARGRDTRSNSVGAGSERGPRWARRCPGRPVLPVAFRGNVRKVSCYAGHGFEFLTKENRPVNESGLEKSGLTRTSSQQTNVNKWFRLNELIWNHPFEDAPSISAQKQRLVMLALLKFAD